MTGNGPATVITDLAVMGFDDRTREMILEAWFPGRSPADVLERMEFAVDVSRAAEVMAPTPEELKAKLEELFGKTEAKSEK